MTIHKPVCSRCGRRGGSGNPPIGPFHWVEEPPKLVCLQCMNDDELSEVGLEAEEQYPGLQVCRVCGADHYRGGDLCYKCGNPERFATTSYEVLSRAVTAAMHFLSGDHEYSHSARCEIVSGALADALAAAQKMEHEASDDRN